MLCSMAGHRDCISVLINAGAKINKQKVRKCCKTRRAKCLTYDRWHSCWMVQEGDGWTALILAAQYHHPLCVELLVEQGANLNQSAGGKTARGGSCVMCASTIANRALFSASL
jgi:hypothetical protein